LATIHDIATNRLHSNSNNPVFVAEMEDNDGTIRVKHEDDFEIQKYMSQYKRDLRRIKLFFYGLPIVLVTLVAIVLLTKLMP